MALANKGRSLSNTELLDRPLFGELKIDWELVAYIGIVLIAVATRFWDLGSRALHHDESLHALYSWYLYVGRGYQHDPMMHGPFQFHAVALIYLLFGASDYTTRVVPAIFGVWVVIAPYFLRREMGRTAALVASALFALSPSFMYFSRFIRNDIYMAGWAMMIVIGLFGYLRERRSFYIYLVAIGAAFSFATKETVYITGFAFVVFLILDAVVSSLRKQSATISVIFSRMTRRDWVVCVALFLGINLVLYTTFFTNPRGVLSGTTGALSYWLAQQGVQRGGQPWYYYLLLIPLYEFLPIVGAVGGFVFLSVKRQWLRLNRFTWFLLVWFVCTLVVYSWAGEKMPWLDLHIAQPLLLLGAMAIAGLLKRFSAELFVRRRGVVALVLTGALAGVVLGGLIAAPPLAGTQLGMQASQMQRMAMAVVAFALLMGIVAIGRKHGAEAALVPAGSCVLAVLLVLTVRTAWGVVYTRGDIPQDMLVYVQTSPDVTRTMREIERISEQTGTGKDIKILLDGGYTDNVGGQSVTYESVAWPFEWYLRDYKNKSYYSKTFSTPTDAAVIIAMAPNEEPIKSLVGNYVAVRGRLNWWYPEDYKGLTLEKIWQGVSDPAIRGKLWRYFLYKETLNPLGSRDFDFFVRSDLARGISQQTGVAGATTQPVGQPAEVVAQVAGGGVTILGKTSSGGSILGEPKGLAVASDGSVYVTDIASSKVVVFKPDGSVAAQWGRQGTGDGEFMEPWGVAVTASGEVYVADTWNHRIQKFDRNGKFLLKWGGFVDTKGQLDMQPGLFWGPRAIAVAPNGNVFVTDTGNKRIQQFSSEGRFISMFGGDGSEPGRVKEPVGLATDSTGNLYVADTWNRRIQKFDGQQRPVAQFAVADWESQSLTNKPYLAVDKDGRIIYTVPEKHKFVVIDQSGRMEGSRGNLGADPLSFNTPTGIAVTSVGEVLVGDSRNGRVVKYQGWR